MPRLPRPGFTLLEVALAVTVGLMITAGAFLGYQATKENAGNATARNRVLTGVTLVEEYAAMNHGNVPPSVAAGGAFTQIWQKRRSEDKHINPWGGPAGPGTGVVNSGVVESDPVDFGASSADAASAPIAAESILANAANLQYVTPSHSSRAWGAVTVLANGELRVVKNYAVGIFSKTGEPWWEARGGK